MSNLYDIPLSRIDGTDADLGEHQGDVMLVVNVASKCGLTPQYEGLETLFETHKDRGFVVCGFPANDFAGQEPGSNDEIAEFCTTNFGVKFPMYGKIQVTGGDKHELYASLIDARPERTELPDSGLKKTLTEHGLLKDDPQEVMWNFEKFLVSREGEVVGRFAPDITVDDDLLTAALEAELSKSAAN